MTELDDDGALVEPPGSVIASMTQCTTLAMHCLQRRSIQRAIKLMERALAICKGHESVHPAVAVEAARARLNLSATLANANRHREALEAIQLAQHRLASVIEWAADCSQDDETVVLLAQEAQMLQCGAKVAEAIEVEHFESGASRPASASKAPDALRVKQQRQLYLQAHQMAEGSLPRVHPLVSLTGKFLKGDARAVCAVGAATAPSPSAPKAQVSTKHRVAAERPPTTERGETLQVSSVTPPVHATVVHEPEPLKGEATHEPAIASEPLPVHATSKFGGGESRSASKKSKPAAVTTVPKRFLGPPKPKDIFQEYLRGIEDEKLTRFGALHEGAENDTRKRLVRISRVSRMDVRALEEQERKIRLDNIYDLKYSGIGHAMCMKNMTKENASRSDPAIVKESLKCGECPEAVHLRRLGAPLPKIRPPTPEPPKPTKKDLAISAFSDMIKSQ
eukprot:CAMPEP_0117543432 /NCGR_PEP_ID=MMETSP0784-20121206/45059_1 /TAXON_ID=39447 /ORGANISM="" /LENGTH=449 /DNA_ID=CAMNT_0005340213 /DNA_START=182 /DNA_END=1528 /DNA_ORIENTATION=-